MNDQCDTPHYHEQDQIDRVKNADQKLLEKLKAVSLLDNEMAHIEADKLLCETLHNLGYHDSVEFFNAQPFWYA